MSAVQERRVLKPQNFTQGVFQKKAWQVCYDLEVEERGGVWRVQSTMMESLPVTTLQLIIVMAITRFLMFAFKPLHQPRIIAEIIGGMLVGPTGMGDTDFALRKIVPFSNMVILETVGNLGLIYYMFVVGLELDLKPVIRAGRKALSIALAGILVSLPLGCALLYFVLIKDWPRISELRHIQSGPIFWGIALTTTSFPDLTGILADLKLLHSEMGRLALSAAVISELISWFLLILGTATIDENKYMVLGSTVLFIALCVFAVRPFFAWVIRWTTKDNNTSYNELLVPIVLSAVLLFGYITDLCGSHSIVGAFVLGAIVPREGELKKKLVEKIQSFVSLFMTPLFFLTIGLRTNLEIIFYSEGTAEFYAHTSEFRVIAVCILAFASKFVTTVVAALMNKLSSWDSLALGMLMNTKGLLALIILGTAKDLKVLDTRAFTTMVVAILIMTAPIGPFLAFVYKSGKHSSTQYQLKTIQSLGSDTELRVLICSHSSSNVSGIIDLLEASNPSNQSPICVFAVQLVELTGHASAMLIVHDACKTSAHRGNDTHSDYTTNNNPFENYAKQRENVSLQTLTAVSSYNTMHEDICNLAEEKCINLIIIPFHMQTTLDGAMEDSNPNLKDVNNNVIENAQCSVGVFVDRGLSIAPVTEPNRGVTSQGYHFAVFFFGGVDDREALTYAHRMAGHPMVNLTVVRLIVVPRNEADNKSTHDDDKNNNDGINRMEMETQMQKQLDDTHVDAFRLRTMHKPNINFLEEIVYSWEDTLSLIRAMEGEHDLYIVGRRHGSTSPLAALFTYCNDSDELGPMGEALVFPSYPSNTSTLIVQQGAVVDELERDNDPGMLHTNSYS